MYILVLCIIREYIFYEKINIAYWRQGNSLVICNVLYMPVGVNSVNSGAAEYCNKSVGYAIQY